MDESSQEYAQKNVHIYNIIQITVRQPLQNQTIQFNIIDNN